MSVKALFFDIDGTILNSNGIMNRSVYDALLQCKAQGCIIGIVTARPPRLVFRDHEIPGDKAELLDRGIYYNGGTVVDRKHGFYQHTPLPGPVVNTIADCADRYDKNLQVVLQHDDSYHAFKFEMTDDDLVPWGFKRSETRSFETARLDATTKMMIFTGVTWNDPKEDLSELHRQLLESHGDSANMILADSRKCIYAFAKNATKGNAISALISLYGISPDDVAVFGDDTPDIGMFGMFGHSIAMGNAVSSLKQKASYVTLSNDEDGVVHALRNYLKVL